MRPPRSELLCYSRVVHPAREAMPGDSTTSTTVAEPTQPPGTTSTQLRRIAVVALHNSELQREFDSLSASANSSYVL